VGTHPAIELTSLKNFQTLAISFSTAKTFSIVIILSSLPRKNKRLTAENAENAEEN
jgi:hypothetical protein